MKQISNANHLDTSEATLFQKLIRLLDGRDNNISESTPNEGIPRN